MALTYVKYQFEYAGASVGGAITSTSRTYNVGDLVWFARLVDYDEAFADTLTVSNSGAAQAWNLIARQDNHDGNNCDIAIYWCSMNVTQAMTITISANTASAFATWLQVVSHSGQDTSNPIPAGNVFKGSTGSNVTQTITPSATGSCLWMYVGDWNATNTLSAAANCTIDGGDSVTGHASVGLFSPLTQPRPNVAAFTLGENDTSARIAWIAFEVQALVVKAGGLTMLGVG